MKIFVIGLMALLLAGCAALDGITPVTDAEFADAIADQAEAQRRSIEEASEGDLLTAAMYAAIAALTSGGLVVGASKRRRKVELAKVTLAKAAPSA